MYYKALGVLEIILLDNIHYLLSYALGNNTNEPYQCSPVKRGFAQAEKDSILKVYKKV